MRLTPTEERVLAAARLVGDTALPITAAAAQSVMAEPQPTVKAVQAHLYAIARKGYLTRAGQQDFALPAATVTDDG